MRDFQPRFSPRFLRIVGRIERLQGRLDKALSQADLDPTFRSSDFRSGAQAILELENVVSNSSSATRSGDHSDNRLQPEAYSRQEPGLNVVGPVSLQSIITAHSVPWTLSLNGLQILHAFASGLPLHPQQFTYRTGQTVFRFPTAERDESLFPTVAPFLLETRLNELLQWAAEESRVDRLHPIVITATFLLLFLQCSPFEQANHRVGLLAAWHLLVSEYPMLRVQHFTPYLLTNRSRYATALKTAERSAHSSWNTIGSWFEFFAEAVLDAAERANDLLREKGDRLRLTEIQQQIVEVVQSGGPVSREQIANRTGINLSTIKYNLNVLSTRGLLQRRGGGRTTSYTAE